MAEQVRLLASLRKRLHGTASMNLENLNRPVRASRFSHGFYCPRC
jgi:hypothetical protein